MTSDCIPVASLVSLDTLADDDPGRIHVERCPRCRARLASYRSFLRADDVEGADPEDAEGRLSAALALLAAGRDADRGAPGFARALRLPARRAMRSVLSLAAVLVVAAGLWRALMPSPAGEPGALVLRGDAVPPNAPLALPSRSLPDGRLSLAWRRQPEADGYRVILHDADLAEVARVDAGADSTVVVLSGVARFWRVVALREGDEIGHTELAPLRSAE